MESPRLTVFNGQRAYIAIITQRAYVSGVSSVTAESAVGLNYTFSILSTGVTFDVRPFVSADRRYVQLTLQPSVSTLKALVDQPVALAAIGTIIEATVQLPTIELVELRTTVSVPDEGTLIVGGLAITSDTLSEEGVPVLSKLPIIKRFFSRKAKGTDRSNLLIFIRPQIVIQEEWEPQ
jgi:type II secretory pathway component GspD/PulD (secretin)